MERHPNFIVYLFPDRTEEAKEERVLSFSGYSATPSPNPLPKGEGVCLQRLGTLSSARVTPCSPAALVYSRLDAREKRSHNRLDSDDLRAGAQSESEESHRAHWRGS